MFEVQQPFEYICMQYISFFSIFLIEKNLFSFQPTSLWNFPLWNLYQTQKSQISRALNFGRIVYSCRTPSPLIRSWLRRYVFRAFRPKRYQDAPTDIFPNSSSISPLQVGLSSFHQQAIHFLCADIKWACQIWDNFSAASPDLRLSLVTWVVDGRGLQHAGLNEAIQRVLQVSLDFSMKKTTFSKNLSNNFQHSNLLTAQCEEIGEA